MSSVTIASLGQAGYAVSTDDGRSCVVAIKYADNGFYAQIEGDQARKLQDDLSDAEITALTLAHAYFAAWKEEVTWYCRTCGNVGPIAVGKVHRCNVCGQFSRAKEESLVTCPDCSSLMMEPLEMRLCAACDSFNVGTIMAWLKPDGEWVAKGGA